MHLEGIEVKALCDLRKENIERAERILQESGRPKAENYSEEGMWRRMCECKEIDLVYICTDWLTHTEIAVMSHIELGVALDNLALELKEQDVDGLDQRVMDSPAV